MILAVEDDRVLRRTLVRQLAELGYRVLEAGNAADALRQLEAGPVNLMFSDVIMPGESTVSPWPPRSPRAGPRP